MLACLLCAQVVCAATEKHIRVIVDTSISMRGTERNPPTIHPTCAHLDSPAL
jgi:hypothetical protein